MKTIPCQDIMSEICTTLSFLRSTPLTIKKILSTFDNLSPDGNRDSEEVFCESLIRPVMNDYVFVRHLAKMSGMHLRKYDSAVADATQNMDSVPYSASEDYKTVIEFAIAKKSQERQAGR